MIILYADYNYIFLLEHRLKLIPRSISEIGRGRREDRSNMDPHSLFNPSSVKKKLKRYVIIQHYKFEYYQYFHNGIKIDQSRATYTAKSRERAWEGCKQAQNEN